MAVWFGIWLDRGLNVKTITALFTMFTLWLITYYVSNIHLYPIQREVHAERKKERKKIHLLQLLCMLIICIMCLYESAHSQYFESVAIVMIKSSLPVGGHEKTGAPLGDCGSKVYV